jgi:hypothetical protein
MEILLLYVMLSLLFLSMGVNRLSNFNIVLQTARNRDIKLFANKLIEKEKLRCKLFIVWPAVILYESLKLFRGR